MKRRIVQHGPCTLTVSLPAQWVKDFALKKGDEITIEQMREGLFITAGKERHYGKKRISVKGMPRIIPKAIAALYKGGYDEIVVEYGNPEELEKIHEAVSSSYIGFEIVDEKKEEVWIRKVSEPAQEEFRTLFRRIFHFLISTADEGLEAARRRDTQACQKLVLRDNNVNKLADFCRRVVNKRGQSAYQQDTALYHVIEQLEKIGDNYKEINQLLQGHAQLSKRALALYERANALLKEYESLFFEFSIAKLNSFFQHYDDIMAGMRTGRCAEQDIEYLLQNVAQKLYNLSGVTMILHL